MEFLQTLPLAAGYEASIVFTIRAAVPRPPMSSRSRARRRLSLPDGGKIDCWVVTADYKPPGIR